MIPVITIDGPSGVGKGTIGRVLAQKLGFHFLDSGALYRLTALACQKHHISTKDPAAVAHIAQTLLVQFHLKKDPLVESDILLEGENVREILRTESIGALASQISAYPQVREALVALQHSFARAPGLVADGRDMGTVIFPEALLKFFLIADPKVRAQRRQKQLQAQGIHANIDDLLKEIEARDQRDQTRATAPLLPAKEALIIDTSHLSIDEVLASMMKTIGDLLPL